MAGAWRHARRSLPKKPPLSPCAGGCGFRQSCSACPIGRTQFHIPKRRHLPVTGNWAPGETRARRRLKPVVGLCFQLADGPDERPRSRWRQTEGLGLPQPLAIRNLASFVGRVIPEPAAAGISTGMRRSAPDGTQAQTVPALPVWRLASAGQSETSCRDTLMGGRPVRRVARKLPASAAVPWPGAWANRKSCLKKGRNGPGAVISELLHYAFVLISRSMRPQFFQGLPDRGRSFP